MQSVLPAGATPVFAEATVGEDGSLRLKDAARFALKPGEQVALTIAPIAVAREEKPQPLLGTVTRYDDPFGSAIEPEEWEALR